MTGGAAVIMSPVSTIYDYGLDDLHSQAGTRGLMSRTRPRHLAKGLKKSVGNRVQKPPRAAAQLRDGWKSLPQACLD